MFRFVHKGSKLYFLIPRISAPLSPAQRRFSFVNSKFSQFNSISRRLRREARKEEATMIYRNWSLLLSTVIIWGGVATVGIAGVFVTGAKDKFMDYLKHEGARLRQEDRALMAQSKTA